MEIDIQKLNETIVNAVNSVQNLTQSISTLEHRINNLGHNITPNPSAHQIPNFFDERSYFIRRPELDYFSQPAPSQIFNNTYGGIPQWYQEHLLNNEWKRVD